MSDESPLPSDRDLVAAYLRSREEAAFRVLYRRHSPVIYRVLLRVTRGEESEAEEILQVAWIRAAERLERFAWRSSLRSWLTGIALNCWRESVRAGARFSPVADPDEVASRIPAPVRHDVAALDLERAIAELPRGYRTVLILHDVEGYTHEEIGELMGIRGGTSKSQLSRARRAVRNWLHERGERVHARRAI